MKESSIERAREGFAKLQASEALRKRAEANLALWLADERFRDAWPQVERLIDSGNAGLVFDAFFQDLPFGTGGRRGPVGFGPNRMNPHTVATSVEGHSHFLRERFPATELSVVVAYDVRVFNDLRRVYDPALPNRLLGMSSKDFAMGAAEVYAANGIRVWMPDPSSGRLLSTPELSFSIRSLSAHAGLNVSASHNHPDDNGAKVYNEKGSQEIPPTDEVLARIVEATTAARSVPFAEAVQRGLVRWIPGDVHEEYLRVNADVSRDRSARSARIVFTPLHGAGWGSAGEALERAGFSVEIYPEQASPDGGFPTVPFRAPNPEVREALHGARDHAKRLSADLVLGTDPDADRLGMMAPEGDDWIFFGGNEIGVLLAHYLLVEKRRAPRVSGGRPFAVTTLVTTSLFSRIAHAAGAAVIDDLGVGFKYIADVLNSIEDRKSYRDLCADLDDFVLGIEESHGYLVLTHVRDKDAAGAAVLLAEIASRLRESGTTFAERLDAIYAEFGCVRNLLVSTVMTGAQGFLDIRAIQASLREKPPRDIGGRKIVEFTDRWSEEGPLGPIRSETDRMSRDLLVFALEGGSRIVLRPSGTESKNKVYVETAGSPLGAAAPRTLVAAEKARLDGEARFLAKAFTREMLSRIGVALPDYALEVSDLVSLDGKKDFAGKFLPELLARIQKGEEGEPLGVWIDERLRGYGADGRLLVAPGIRAFLQNPGLTGEEARALEAAFFAAGPSGKGFPGHSKHPGA